jgi:hypothetical protein
MATPPPPISWKNTVSSLSSEHTNVRTMDTGMSSDEIKKIRKDERKKIGKIVSIKMYFSSILLPLF